MDVLNRFSFSNRFAKEMVQETCSQTDFAPRGINQTGLKQRFPIMSISNRFAQPNQFKIIELAQCSHHLMHYKKEGKVLIIRKREKC